MKWLFVVLVAANLLVFAWFSSRSEKGAPQEQPTNSSTDAYGLVALRDLPKASLSPLYEGPSESVDNPPAIPANEPTLEPSQPAKCLFVSGFVDRSDAEHIQERLKIAGVKASIGYDETVAEYFWVFVPPNSTASKPIDVVKRMQAAGLTDLYLVRSGQYVNAISLGVFVSHAGAERRSSEVRSALPALPSPAIHAVTLPARRYWLRLPGASMVDGGVKSLLAKDSLTVRTEPCR